MQLTINTTPEHDAALAELNAASNPVNRPNLDVFIIQVLLGKLDDLVVSNQNSKVDLKVQDLKSKALELTPADLDTIQAVLDAHP